MVELYRKVTIGYNPRWCASMTTRRPPPRARWPPRNRGSRALPRLDTAPATDAHRAARSHRSVAACSGDTKAALAAEDALHAASQVRQYDNEAAAAEGALATAQARFARAAAL